MSITTVAIALRAEVSSYIAGMKSAGKATVGFATTAAQAVKQHEQAFNTAGRAATAFGALAAAGVGAALKSAADFDQAMSEVNASTHESAQNMGLLRQAALDAGAKTVFSATSAAGAIDALAKAGVSTSDVLGGALNGALSLASAGSLDVGEAAETAASAMTQFSLKGTDVGHIADLLAAGAGKAQGSVHDLGMALNQSGLVAGQLGLSIEETTGGLAAFASAGLIGSDAGTSFKTMLLSLNGTSKQAKSLIDDLGISAYDSQGNFIGLANYAGRLQGALKGMTSQQRTSTLQTIFGSDAIRAANVLYSQGAKGITDWTSKVDDQGFAADTAARKLDNLKGDLEQLSGALETALIGTGEGGQTPLRGVTQELTGLINQYNGLPGPAKNATLAIGTVAAAVGLSSGALLLALPRIASTILAYRTLGTTMPGVTKAARGAGLALKGLGAAALVFTAIQGVEAFFHKSSSALTDFAEEVTVAAGPKTTDQIDAVKQKMVELQKEIDSSAHVDIAGTRLFGFGAGKAAAAADKYDQLKKTLAELEHQEKLGTLAAAAQGKATGDAGDAAGGAATGQDKLAAGADGATSAMKDERTEAEKLKDAIDLLNGNSISVARANIALQDSLDNIKASFKGNNDTLRASTKAGRDHTTAVLDGIAAAEDYAAAVVDQTGSQEKGRTEYAKQIGVLRQVLLHTGLTRAEVDKLIATYAKVPPAKKTTVTADDQASPKLAILRGVLDALPKSKTVTIFSRYVQTTPIPAGIAAPAVGAGAGVGALRGLSIGRQRAAALTPDQRAAATAAGALKASTSTALSTAAAALQKIGDAYDAANEKADAAARRAELVGARAAAERAVAKAARTADKADNVSARQDLAQAKKDLVDFDRDATRSRIARRITAQQDRIAAAATLAGNREAYAFEKLTTAQQLEDVKKRLAGEKKYSDGWMQLAQQRDQLQQKIDDDAASLVANRAAWDFDHLNTQQQLDDVKARIAGETQYSDAWMELAQQRDGLEQKLADERQQVIDQQTQQVDEEASKLNDLLDEQARITGEITDAQNEYAAAVKTANDALATQTEQIKKTRVEALAGWADLTTAPTMKAAPSANALLRNAKAQVQQFTDWMEQLDLARQRGTSEDLIKALGLDAGPQSLAQLRQLNKGTADQVDELNRLVATQHDLAAQETDREATGGYGQVGADIAAATAENTQAIQDAFDALAATTASHNDELANLGLDQGRTVADAIAQGLLSGSPGVVDAARRVFNDAGFLNLLTGGDYIAGHAAGGPIYGIGTSTSDSNLRRLSAGEYVVNAAAYARNRQLVESINAGRIPTQAAQGPQTVKAEVDMFGTNTRLQRVIERLDVVADAVRSSGGSMLAPAPAGW